MAAKPQTLKFQHKTEREGNKATYTLQTDNDAIAAAVSAYLNKYRNQKNQKNSKKEKYLLKSVVSKAKNLAKNNKNKRNPLSAN